MAVAEELVDSPVEAGLALEGGGDAWGWVGGWMGGWVDGWMGGVGEKEGGKEWRVRRGLGVIGVKTREKSRGRQVAGRLPMER